MKLAHDHAMEYMDSYSGDMETLVSDSWKYADLMFEQEEKRKVKGVPEAIQDVRALTTDENGNCLHFHHEFGHKKCMDCGECLHFSKKTGFNGTECVDCGAVLKPSNTGELEWQPDWSQAPKHMNYFAMNKSGVKLWHVNKPELSLIEWIIDFSNCGGDCYSFASKQDYQGDWRNSLRKRPQ